MQAREREPHGHMQVHTKHPYYLARALRVDEQLRHEEPLREERGVLVLLPEARDARLLEGREEDGEEGVGHRRARRGGGRRCARGVLVHVLEDGEGHQPLRFCVLVD